MHGDRPKLLVLTSTFPRWRGDSEPAFVFELCRRLAPRFQVRVLAPHAPGAARHETLDDVAIVRFRYLPERWQSLAYEGGIPARLRARPLRLLQVPGFVAAQFCALVRELRGWRPDLVHAHWVLPQGICAALGAHCATRRPALICTAHGADLYTFNGPFGRRLKSATLRAMDAVSVVGGAMRDPALGLGAEPGRLTVASMGVDTSGMFTPGQAARDPALLLFSGRLVEKKGVRYLIEALVQVRSEYPLARLVIAGEGPERPELERLTAALGLAGAVEFRGALAQPALAELYRRAAVTVLPFVRAADGDQEGLGLVVAEAQACACPVVVGDVPAADDTVRDGETGLLATSADAAALARQVLRLLGDAELRRRLGAEGRRAAVARFDWDQVAARYTTILQSALKHAAARRG